MWASNIPDRPRRRGRPPPGFRFFATAPVATRHSMQTGGPFPCGGWASRFEHPGREQGGPFGFSFFQSRCRSSWWRGVFVGASGGGGGFGGTRAAALRAFAWGRHRSAASDTRRRHPGSMHAWVGRGRCRLQRRVGLSARTGREQPANEQVSPFGRCSTQNRDHFAVLRRIRRSQNAAAQRGRQGNVIRRAAAGRASRPSEGPARARGRGRLPAGCPAGAPEGVSGPPRGY